MTKKIPLDQIAHLGCESNSAIDDSLDEGENDSVKSSELLTPTKVIQGSYEAKDFFNGEINYSFLTGVFGRRVLNEYKQLAKDEFPKAKVLEHIFNKKDIVRGGNSFVRVLLNRVLKNYGKWIARPIDFENATKTGLLKKSVYYGDLALAIRYDSEVDEAIENKYLTSRFATQLNEKGYEVDKDPIMVPLAGLDLEYDSNSEYKLDFKLTDLSEIISSPQLKRNGSDRFDEVDNYGLPILIDGGSRRLVSDIGNGLYSLDYEEYSSMVVWYSGFHRRYHDMPMIVCSK